jgi:signal transduction histidine kinase
MMSHELRTPLQTIAGNAELLLTGCDGPLTPLQAEDVRAIQSGATRMTTLIAQLLELARPDVDSGDRFIDPEELLQVVDQVRQDMAPHAAARQLTLRVDLPRRLPPVRGDAVRLRQSLLNLVANAIKFTETGEVRISAEVAAGEVVVTVRDTGIGIAAEALPLIFEEFYQVDSAMTRRYEGAGLGLAIARRLVEQMGGTLTVESQLGAGSAFTLHLPVAETLAPPAAFSPPL